MVWTGENVSQLDGGPLEKGVAVEFKLDMTNHHDQSPNYKNAEAFLKYNLNHMK